jgi:serine/threonine protein kinase
LDVTRAGLGTEYYCAPEQWNDKGIGPYSDIYSLGMTIARIYNINSPPGIGCPSSYTNTNNKDINKLINDMTTINLSQRIQTMREVVDRIAYILLFV